MAASGGRPKPGAKFRAPPPPRPAIVLIDADTHFGSVLAPVSTFTKTNGQEETPTDVQRFLADAWMERVEYFRRLQDELGASLVYVHMGDVTEGVKHRSGQRFSEDPEDHVRLAKLMIRPVMELADVAIAIRGTEAHAGIGSSLEEAVFSEFRGKMWRPHAGSKTLTHYRVHATISGVRFDLEHHVAGAGRPWTYGGNIQRRAVSAVFEMARKSERMADYVVRAHLHIGHDTGDNPPQPRGIICRSWKGPGDAFGHRIASEFEPVVGCQYVVIRGPEDHSFRWWTAPLPKSKTWHDIEVKSKRRQ